VVSGANTTAVDFSRWPPGRGWPRPAAGAAWPGPAGLQPYSL